MRAFSQDDLQYLYRLEIRAVLDGGLSVSGRMSGVALYQESTDNLA